MCKASVKSSCHFCCQMLCRYAASTHVVLAQTTQGGVYTTLTFWMGGRSYKIISFLALLATSIAGFETFVPWFWLGAVPLIRRCAQMAGLICRTLQHLAPFLDPSPNTSCNTCALSPSLSGALAVCMLSLSLYALSLYMLSMLSEGVQGLVREALWCLVMRLILFLFRSFCR